MPTRKQNQQRDGRRAAPRPVVTLTPNPSVDRTLHVAGLVRGGVLRTTATAVHASGKGVNVARTLAANGLPTVAVAPLGGSEGSQLAELAAAEGVRVLAVPIAGTVRSNISLVEADGTVTKVNEAGPWLSEAEVEALLAATVRTVAAERPVALCVSGSLPGGMSAGLYAELAARLADHAPGTLLVVDTSGPALAAALAARPALVKPNLQELAEAVGQEPGTLGEVVEAARTLRERGPDRVLVSLGADGAVLVGPDGAVHGQARAHARNPTGAGDALLAGFLAGLARGHDEPESLALALTWAAAAVTLADSGVPGPGDMRPAAVTVHDTVQADRVLTERAVHA